MAPRQCHRHVKPWMLGQPCLDRGCLGGTVVVADQVDVQIGRHGLVDGDQELALLVWNNEDCSSVR